MHDKRLSRGWRCRSFKTTFCALPSTLTVSMCGDPPRVPGADHQLVVLQWQTSLILATTADSLAPSRFATQAAARTLALIATGHCNNFKIFCMSDISSDTKNAGARDQAPSEHTLVWGF